MVDCDTRPGKQVAQVEFWIGRDGLCHNISTNNHARKDFNGAMIEAAEKLSQKTSIPLDKLLTNTQVSSKVIEAMIADNTLNGDMRQAIKQVYNGLAHHRHTGHDGFGAGM